MTENEKSIKIRELTLPGEASSIKNPAHRILALESLAKRRYDAQPSWMDRGPTMFERANITWNPMTNGLECNQKPIPGSRKLLSTEDDGDMYSVDRFLNSAFVQIDKKTIHHPRTPILTNRWMGKVVMVLMMKNEGAIIERMIDSLHEHIDAFVVTDTGSTDDSIIKLWNRLVIKYKKRGTVYLCPFENFGTTRTVAVQLAYQTGDWLLLFDADYKLQVKDSDWRSKLKDVYYKDKRMQSTSIGHIPQRVKEVPIGQYLLDTTGNLQYARPHLVRGDILWCYHCRTHEFLAQSKCCPSGLRDIPSKRFPGLMIDHVQDGGAKHDKSPRDIMMLFMDLKDDETSARAMFYLANSLSADGLLTDAMKWYKSAMNRCGWYEEMFCATKEAIDTQRRLFSEALQNKPEKALTLLGRVTQKKDLEDPIERLVIFCLAGLGRNPHRLESLKSLMDYVKDSTISERREKYEFLMVTLASFFTFNGRAMDKDQPDEGQKLFVDLAVHDFYFWVDLAIFCAHRTMFLDLGAFAIEKAVQHVSTPEGKEAIHPRSAWEARQTAEIYDAAISNRAVAGMRTNKKIRTFLMEQAEQAFLNNQYARSKEYLEEMFLGVVTKSLLSAELIQECEKDNDPQIRRAHCESWKTQIYHRNQRLTAWKSISSLYCGQKEVSHVSELDLQLADACCALAKAQHMIDPSNYLAVVAYYINALKFNVKCTMAISELQKMQKDAPSMKSRVIQKLLHFATEDGMRREANLEQSKHKVRIEAAIGGQVELMQTSSVHWITHEKSLQHVLKTDMITWDLERRGRGKMWPEMPQANKLPFSLQNTLLNDLELTFRIWEQQSQEKGV